MQSFPTFTREDIPARLLKRNKVKQGRPKRVIIQEKDIKLHSTFQKNMVLKSRKQMMKELNLNKIKLPLPGGGAATPSPAVATPSPDTSVPTEQ